MFVDLSLIILLSLIIGFSIKVKPFHSDHYHLPYIFLCFIAENQPPGHSFESRTTVFIAVDYKNRGAKIKGKFHDQGDAK
jgi:hypothetical protein